MKKSSLFDIALIALVLILATITFMLAMENRELKDKLDGKLGVDEEHVSVLNSAASPIMVKDFDGVVKVLSFENQQVPTLLFIFTTTCPHCEHSVISWNAIAEMFDSSECRIVGLSLDSIDVTKQYFAANHVKFNVVSLADSSMKKSYNIWSIPQTFIISTGGLVTHAWGGRFELNRIGDVAKALRKGEDGGS